MCEWGRSPLWKRALHGPGRTPAASPEDQIPGVRRKELKGFSQQGDGLQKTNARMGVGVPQQARCVRLNESDSCLTGEHLEVSENPSAHIPARNLTDLPAAMPVVSN